MAKSYAVAMCRYGSLININPSGQVKAMNASQFSPHNRGRHKATRTRIISWLEEIGYCKQHDENSNETSQQSFENFVAVTWLKCRSN